MRKPNHDGPKSQGKAKPFKNREGDSKFKKSAPGRGKAKDEGEGFSGRKPKPRSSEDRPGARSGAGSFRKSAPRAERPAGRDKAGADRPRRSFDGDAERKPRQRDGEERPASGRRPKPFTDKPRRSFDNDTERKPRQRDGEERPASRKPRSFDDKPRRSVDRDAERSPRRTNSEEGPASRKPRSFDDKPDRTRTSPADFGRDKYARKSSGKPFNSEARKYGERKSFDDKPAERKFSKKNGPEDESIKRVKFDDFEEGKVFSNTENKKATIQKKGRGDKTKFKKSSGTSKPQTGDGLVRLNKYLSNAGIASRREADTLIQSGVVKVNGVVVDQLGYKINPGDKVTYGDAPVKGERKVYLLLNKPKDYITTLDDPQERKTVMELIAGVCKERVYPVGRLDRNTTGLLLFTNDGELTTRLTHPKFGIKKVYHVSLNKGLKPDDFKAIAEGFELEDGFIKADDVAFVGEGKKEIGIEIHSGRNRIVRRIFEHLGYDVLKLDRVVFAGLTKKDLPRGKHRFLTAKEIGFLQMIG